MLETHKKQAIQYSSADWSFSSAHAWEIVVAQDSSPLNLLNWAEQLRLTGCYSKALKWLEQIDSNEIPAEHQFLLPMRKGLILEDSGRLAEAVIAYQDCAAFQPEEAYPYVFLASALSKLERLDEAQQVLEIALKQTGTQDEIWYNLSLIYARTGRWKSAVNAMEECLAIDPDFPQAGVWLEDFRHMQQTNTGNIADDQVLPDAR